MTPHATPGVLAALGKRLADRARCSALAHRGCRTVRHEDRTWPDDVTAQEIQLLQGQLHARAAGHEAGVMLAPLACALRGGPDAGGLTAVDPVLAP